MPDCFVARKHLVLAGRTEPTAALRAAWTLDEVRAMLPSGLVCVTRNEEDDPRIVETWF